MKKLVLGSMSAVALSSCVAMGGSVSPQKKEEFKESKNYNVKKEQFVNRRVGLIDEMWKRNMSLGSIAKFFKGQSGLAPKEKLPEVSPDLVSFLKESSSVKVIWFGHSTLLLNIEGKVVLIDPVFSEAASPVSFLVKRYQKPVLNLDELPEVDYIVISHDHYDHLDMKSVKFFTGKKAKFITPLGVGSHLEKWGIARNRIVERDWWQEVEYEGLRFIATPAQHFSGRGLFDRKKTLWASWVIKSQDHSIYFSGDSGFDTHFKEIGDRLGPFDIAFLESGQYNEMWREVHMFPDEAIQAYHDLRAKKFFPIHWGMFTLAYHKWNEPLHELYQVSESSQVSFVTPRLGEVVQVDQDFNENKWWSY